MTYRRIGCWLLFFVLASCRTTIDFESFDSQAWQGDRNGCLGQRENLLPDLMKEKDKLMGMNQQTVAWTLGQPDRQELYVHNQKFFIYFVDPSDACSGQDLEELPQQLHLRFDAIGKVNEISLQY